MDGMIYLATSGAATTLRSQVVHANNLANLNTTGFKSDSVALTKYDAPDQSLKTKSFAALGQITTNFAPGTMISTGRELDIAVNGEGFIAVQSKDGTEAYTRNGNLQIDEHGMLMTSNHYPVMGAGGQINIPANKGLELGTDGTINIIPLNATDNKTVVLDTIKLVKPEITNLIKGKDGLIRTKDGKAPDIDNSIKIVSRSVEGSNVNAIDAITNMITTARSFELQMKLISAAEQNDQAHSKLLALS